MSLLEINIPLQAVFQLLLDTLHKHAQVLVI